MNRLWRIANQGRGLRNLSGWIKKNIWPKTERCQGANPAEVCGTCILGTDSSLNQSPKPGWYNWGTAGKPVLQGPRGNGLVENKEARERTEKERVLEYVGSCRSLWRLQLVVEVRWEAPEVLRCDLKIHFERVSLASRNTQRDKRRMR